MYEPLGLDGRSCVGQHGVRRGASDGDTAAPSTTTESLVASADGLATLLLAPASLPEGVSPDDIQLEVRVIDSDDPAMPIVVVQLLPDGLVLRSLRR